MQPQGWKNFLFAVLLVPNGANLFGIRVDGAWATNLQTLDIQDHSPSKIKYLARTEVTHQQCQKPQRLFEKSNMILIQAIRNRGYTDKTQRPGFKMPNFWLVRAGGLGLCSSELYSPKTFQTCSQLDVVNYDSSQLGTEDYLCKHSSVLPSFDSQISPNPITRTSSNPQPNQAPSKPTTDANTPTVTDSVSKNQQGNESSQIETQPNNFPIPSRTPIEQLLPASEIDYSQRLERLRRRLGKVKQPPVESNRNTELGLVVRQISLSKKPLEQQPPPPIKKPVSQFKPVGYLQARVGYFNTSNIFSSKDAPQEEGLIFSGLTLASTYLPLGRKTFLNGSIDGTMIHYTNQSQYDYNQIRFNLGIYQQLSPRMYGEISGSNQKLFYTKNSSSFAAGDRFLNETSLRLSLGRRDTLSSKLKLDTFYELSLNIADPDSRNRIINSLWLSLSYYLQKPLHVGLNYQFNLLNFTHGDAESRQDEFHRLFGNLTYRISDFNNMNLQAGLTFGGSTAPNIDFGGWFFSVNYNFDLGQF